MFARWASTGMRRLQRTVRRVKSSRPEGSAAAAPMSFFSREKSRPRCRPARTDASAIHGTSWALVFHHSARAPPGRSTRRASGTERTGSVQCQDWA